MATYTPEQQAVRLAMLQDMAGIMAQGVRQEDAGAEVAQDYQFNPATQTGVAPTNSYTPDDFSAKTLMDAYTSSVGSQAPNDVVGFPQNPVVPGAGDMDYNIDPSAGLVPTLDGAPAYTDKQLFQEDWFPEQMFMDQYGIPTLGQSAYQRWLMQNQWMAEMDYMFGLGGAQQTGSNWSDYLGSGNTLASARSNIMDRLGNISTPQEGQLFRDMVSQGMGMDAVRGAYGLGLRGQFTPGVADYMSSEGVFGNIGRGYEAQDVAGAGTTFMDYIQGLMGGAPKQSGFGQRTQDTQQVSQIPLTGPYNQQPSVDQAIPGAPPSQAMIDIARNQTPAYDYINGQWVRI